MGLLIGVGNTKPSFPYDYYYGIEWDITVSNKKPTRIGKMELHQSLPLQNMMCRCILKDDGTVNYYLHPNDSTKRDNSAAANLTGADGQYMVELPDVYIRFEMDGNKRRCLISTQPLPGFKLWRKDYISAVEATVQRSTQKLCAVVNTDADYRGGGNQADWDELSKTMLGKPATSINLTNFRAYARKRGSTEWNCNLYQTHKKLWWLYAVEYCNFDSQDTFNAELDENGYRQGGLGAGITTLEWSRWSTFNGNNPVVPCGLTNSLGNKSGYIEFTMPFEYDSNGASKYAGKYDAKTAYTAGQYVSKGEFLYTCKADAAAGTALTDTASFTPVARKVVQVPSYRGVENPFGHIWKWTDGCKCLIQSENDGGLSEFHACDDPAAFTSSGVANYNLRGNLPRKEGYVKQVILGDDGEIMPLEVGAGSTTYFCDYFYTNVPTSGIAERGVLFGGHANSGATAGFVYAYTSSSAAAAYANFGSRLCFYPQIE